MPETEHLYPGRACVFRCAASGEVSTDVELADYATRVGTNGPVRCYSTSHRDKGRFNMLGMVGMVDRLAS